VNWRAARWPNCGGAASGGRERGLPLVTFSNDRDLATTNVTHRRAPRIRPWSNSQIAASRGGRHCCLASRRAALGAADWHYSGLEHRPETGPRTVVHPALTVPSTPVSKVPGPSLAYTTPVGVGADMHGASSSGRGANHVYESFS